MGSTRDSAALSETKYIKASNRVTVYDFIKLAKPGIIISNSIAAFGGFWIAFASAEKPLTGMAFLMTMVTAMLGTAFVMASGTVYNNFLIGIWTQKWHAPAAGPQSQGKSRQP